MKHSFIFILHFLLFFQHTLKAQQTVDIDTSIQPETFHKLSGATIAINDMAALIKQNMQTHNVTGLSMALINNGQIALKHQSGFADKTRHMRVTESSIFEAASLSKPLFGFLVMQYVQAGKLDLDKPLYQYLTHPDLTYDPRHKQLTARMVLSHTTGLPNWRTDDPDKGLHMAFEPGSAFRYSGEAYQYLATVLAHIASTDADGLEAIFQEKLAQPLGLNNTQFIADDKLLSQKVLAYDKGEVIDYENNPHEFGAAYSLHTTAEDYALWMQAIMRKELLEHNSYDTYLTGQNVTFDANQPGKNMGLSDWALGFSIYQLPMGTVYVHGGNNPGFSSIAIMSVEHQWALVIFTNSNQVSEFLLNLAQWFL